MIFSELLFFFIIIPFVDTGKPFNEALLPNMVTFIKRELQIGEANQTGMTPVKPATTLPWKTEYG